jgi:hypothetical protein
MGSAGLTWGVVSCGLERDGEMEGAIGSGGRWVGGFGREGAIQSENWREGASVLV